MTTPLPANVRIVTIASGVAAVIDDTDGTYLGTVRRVDGPGHPQWVAISRKGNTAPMRATTRRQAAHQTWYMASAGN